MRPPREPQFTRRASGTSGALCVGFKTAADLGAWTLAGQRAALQLDATIVASAVYWLRQPTHDVVLVVGRDTWTWRNVKVSIVGRTVSATLTGAPESTRGGALSLSHVA